jgi:hypothetical protein
MVAKLSHTPPIAPNDVLQLIIVLLSSEYRSFKTTDFVLVSQTKSSLTKPLEESINKYDIL